MSFVLAFLGFALLIILHEAGHFVVAKAVGMRVERFSLFFPPLIWKTRRGETEYGIGAIPLGGYVKITGMNPEEDIPPEVVHRAYYNQAVWKRVVTILAGPLVNLLIAFFIIFGLVLSQGEVVVHNGQVQVSQRLSSVTGAAASVLRPGDRLVAVDGRRGLSFTQIAKVTKSDRCAGTPVAGCRAKTPVKLLVARGGRTIPVSIYPRYVASAKAMQLGISVLPVTKDVALPTAAWASLRTMGSVTGTTVSTLGRIFQSKERQRVHGVVYSYTATEKSFSTSASQALWVLALISLSLAVVNLFPFLPLDGGHVFWALAEKIRGRRISFAVMERAGLVGFALIAVLFVIGLSNDISTLAGPGIQIR